MNDRVMQLGSHKTETFQYDGMTCVQYWETTVLQYDGSKIILNSGGHKTQTTKTRINQASNQFGLDIHVFQKDFEWFVVLKFDNNRQVPFDDYMEIDRPN